MANPTFVDPLLKKDQSHPCRGMRMLFVRICLTLACGSGMVGCTIMMVEPSRPNSTQLAQGLTFAEAFDYLERARKNMSDGMASVEHADTVTRLGLGVGVGGAAINALAKGGADVTLALLGLSGISYSVAQTSSLPSQRDIYNAGLNSLDCIEKTGYLVHRDTGGARERLLQRRPELEAAVAALTSDLDNVAQSVPVESAAVAIEPESRQVLRSGIALLRSVTAFTNATDIGPEMFYGVSKTTRALNTQLRARAPNLDEIARAGTILTGFLSAHTPVASDAKATTNAAAKLPTIAQAAGHPLADRIERDVNRLRKIAGDIQAILPPAGFSATALLDACQVMIPGQQAFRVRPDGPIRVVAGGDAYSLSVESEFQVSFGFHGAQPSAQQLVVSQLSERTFSFAAPSGAKADKYMFYVAQKGGREMPDIEVTVVAPSPKNTTQRTGNQRTRNSASTPLTLGAKLNLLGLGPDIKSEEDQQFKDRVKKLDNCFGITPSTGLIGNKLVTALRGSEPVNSAGDCPKTNAMASGTQKAVQESASGNNIVPTPNPPVLSPSK